MRPHDPKTLAMRCRDAGHSALEYAQNLRPFSSLETLASGKKKTNKHKHFRRDGLRDKQEPSLGQMGPLPGTKWDPSLGQTGLSLFNSTVKSLVCPVCPWDGWGFVPGTIVPQGPSEKCLCVFCLLVCFCSHCRHSSAAVKGRAVKARLLVAQNSLYGVVIRACLVAWCWLLFCYSPESAKFLKGGGQKELGAGATCQGKLNPVLFFLGLFVNTKENLKNTKDLYHLTNPYKSCKISRKHPKRPRISAARKTPRTQKHQGRINSLSPY